MADRRRTPRKWRKLSPHEYMLCMGPVTIEVDRWGPIPDDPATWRDEWGFTATLSTGHRVARGHCHRRGAPLAKCQADAIAAVERWRDAIR